tara:strand:+ start:1184 stop:2212 length:1029 start_codon:yes stop_codon:yes gene_type:complete
MHLVTGGAGFLGEEIISKLLSQGEKVRSLDLNTPKIKHPDLEIINGDIRDREIVSKATKNVEIVHHNVAQVPIAKNKEKFWSVNEKGTEIILESSYKSKIRHFVYTSSSAVYGVPERNPVTEKSSKIPLEDYGMAKLGGEILCEKFRRKGLSCSIIRPRTILGTGRLGIFQILFEWIFNGKNIPVIDQGKNTYQFIHSSDLADACITAGREMSNDDFNIGAKDFGTMKEALQNLIDHAKSDSKIKSIPSKITKIAMDVTSKIGLSPLGKYHALMYGKDMYFDTTKAEEILSFNPKFSNNEMFNNSYDWYCSKRRKIISGELSGSKHQSKLKQGILRIVPYLI